ncbi:MAG: hypothetical protein M3P34_04365 [Actinomycetota bacterium]|nr:hypothetical protein [Actinomycetota bacterium]
MCQGLGMLFAISAYGYLQALSIPVAVVLLIGVIGALMNEVTGNSWKNWWGEDD